MIDKISNLIAAALEAEGYAVSASPSKWGGANLFVCIPAVREGRKYKPAKNCGCLMVGRDGRLVRGRFERQGGTIERIAHQAIEALKEQICSFTQEVHARLAAEADKRAAEQGMNNTSAFVEECWECGASYDSPGHVQPGRMGCVRCNA